MTGSLCVPNVGLGDIEVRFNQHNSEERDKAIRMLTDMQKRGYAILVRMEDGAYVRAVSIDAERGCYIVQLPDFDAQVAGAEPVGEETPAVVTSVELSKLIDVPVPPAPPKKRGRPRRASIPIERAHAVGVARSAGG